LAGVFGLSVAILSWPAEATENRESDARQAVVVGLTDGVRPGTGDQPVDAKRCSKLELDHSSFV